MDKTKVIFRMWENGQVIAMFPEVAVDKIGYYCQSYMNVGQHSPASPSLVANTKPASKEDYAELMKELVKIGYDNLQVIKKFSYAMQKIRMAMYN